MNLDYKIKTYKQLTKVELYEVLRLRAEVFVVEQNCPYQDVDNKDQKALHVLGYKNEVLIAYTRIFKPHDYFEFSSIGRVVVATNQRRHKYGYQLMKVSIKAVKDHFKQTKIAISAQEHLNRFYSSLGFVQEGEGYLEDKIPHIYMLRDE